MNLLNDTHVLIMAGGRGTRMRSEHPKPLHTLRGVPLIDYVCTTVETTFGENFTVIVGHGRDELVSHLGKGVRTVCQAEQLGTGHAVAVALPSIAALDPEVVVVLPGDHPFISPMTLRAMIAKHKATGVALTMATVHLPNFMPPYDAFWSSGRVVRNAQGNVMRVVEHRDADHYQILIPEVNVSYYIFDHAWLATNIDRLKQTNAGKEFYLTDLVGLAYREGGQVATYTLPNWLEGLGVNTPEELARLEALVGSTHGVTY